MTHQLIKNLDKATEELYEHVGFTPDWVMCPLDDSTQSYWYVEDGTVCYADSKKELKQQDGNYYEDNLYTQRFYPKWVYEGKDLTMVMCDPQVDGVKWFRFFDNSKRMKRV